MHSKGSVEGQMLDCDVPDWEPLLALAPEFIDDFIWMFAVGTDDGRIEAYKHYWTRRYLHLDRRGRAFVDTQDGRYQQVGASWLLDRVLGSHSRR
jgi:hypothetical protein